MSRRLGGLTDMRRTAARTIGARLMYKTLDAAEIISWCFAGDIPCGADPAAAIEAHRRAL